MILPSNPAPILPAAANDPLHDLLTKIDADISALKARLDSLETTVAGFVDTTLRPEADHLWAELQAKVEAVAGHLGLTL